MTHDHGFSKACPSGNHLLEDGIWPKKSNVGNDDDFCDDGEQHVYIDGTCRKCGKSQ